MCFYNTISVRVYEYTLIRVNLLGPWSDNSQEWNQVSEEDKKNAGLQVEEDGEFWSDRIYHNAFKFHLGARVK